MIILLWNSTNLSSFSFLETFLSSANFFIISDVTPSSTFCAALKIKKKELEAIDGFHMVKILQFQELSSLCLGTL